MSFHDQVTKAHDFNWSRLWHSSLPSCSLCSDKASCSFVICNKIQRGQHPRHPEGRGPIKLLLSTIHIKRKTLRWNKLLFSRIFFPDLIQKKLIFSQFELDVNAFTVYFFAGIFTTFSSVCRTLPCIFPFLCLFPSSDFFPLGMQLVFIEKKYMCFKAKAY